MATSTSTVSGNKGPSQALLDTMNGKTAAKKSTAEEAQDRFMKLLVTQMKNQDPLKPLDNAQVTSQLAQLSTVTGIDKLNETLNSMMTNSKASESYQAASLIGHGVMIADSSFSLSQSVGMFGVDLKDAADKVSVRVTDSAGNVLKNYELGQQKAGMIPLSWDGKDANGNQRSDGTYKIEVTATKNGTKVEAATMAVDQVASVSTSKDGVKLNLSNKKSVAMSDIVQII